MKVRAQHLTLMHHSNHDEEKGDTVERRCAGERGGMVGGEREQLPSPSHHHPPLSLSSVLSLWTARPLSLSLSLTRFSCIGTAAENRNLCTDKVRESGRETRSKRKRKRKENVRHGGEGIKKRDDPKMDTTLEKRREFLRCRQARPRAAAREGTRRTRRTAQPSRRARAVHATKEAAAAVSARRAVAAAAAASARRAVAAAASARQAAAASARQAAAASARRAAAAAARVEAAIPQQAQQAQRAAAWQRQCPRSRPHPRPRHPTRPSSRCWGRRRHPTRAA